MHGADALIFIGSDGEADRMLSHHQNILGAARRAGVGRVVLLSSQDADENSPFCYAHTYAVTERWLRKSHPSSVVVRAGLYAEFFGRWVIDAAGVGVLSLPMPTEAVAPVAKADVAAALVGALRAPPAASTVCHVVTGPHAYDHDQLAYLATQLEGRPVASRPVSTAEFAQGMLATGVSPWWRYAFETMFAAIERGSFAATTDSVRHLTGRAPIPFRRVLHALPPHH